MLYKRPDSKIWWVRFTDPVTHKQVRRSTGTENKKEAKEYEARLISDGWRQDRLGEQPVRTWEEAAGRWLEEMEHKASHQDDVNLLRWLQDHLKGRALHLITSDVINEVAKIRRETGVAPATVNRMLALVRAILKRAETRWKWIERAPHVQMMKADAGRIRWLTRDEAARLLAELPEHLELMARFTLATGLRASNVTHLTWSQIDLERRVAWIHPDQAKARRAIGVPLNADAVLVLRRCQGRHPERVFCYHRQAAPDRWEWTPIEEANGRAWYKAVERAGIEDFRWHDLRHTWASWHVQAGTPLQTLMELGGWASYAMVLRYAHLAP